MRASTILVHDRLHAVISATPGIHIRRIALVTGMSWNTVLHHLRNMEQQGRVTSAKVEGKVCWFDRSHGAYVGKQATAVLRDRQNQRIAAYILENPGQNQVRLAHALELPTSVVHRRVVRLEEAGLVDRFQQSRSMVLFAAESLPRVARQAGLLQEAIQRHGRMQLVDVEPFDDVPRPGRKVEASVAAPVTPTVTEDGQEVAA